MIYWNLNSILFNLWLFISIEENEINKKIFSIIKKYGLLFSYEYIENNNIIKNYFFNIIYKKINDLSVHKI